MLIRSEAPVDILAIDRLLKKTFETDLEANLVMALRENSHNTLSLVACSDDGELIGHVMFSPVLIHEQDIGVQGLAPLCVRSDYRGQGIATQLVREGLEILAELGYPACVVFGQPNYYRRLDFFEAEAFQLESPWFASQSALMAITLNDSGFGGKAGKVTYCPEFFQM